MSDEELSEEFILTFSRVLENHWPLLATILSFTTDEIEQIKREVTGVPSVKAAVMMRRWREKSSSTYKATYGLLKSKVSCILKKAGKP